MQVLSSDKEVLCSPDLWPVLSLDCWYQRYVYSVIPSLWTCDMAGFSKVVFFYLIDGNGSQNKYFMLKYYFDGPEMDFKIKPHSLTLHSSAQLSQQENSTERSWRQQHRRRPSSRVLSNRGEKLRQEECQCYLETGTKYQRSSTRRTMCCTVCANLLKEQKNCSWEMSKRLQIPSVCCVLTGFLTQPEGFGILTVDTTYNLGQFYVTPTTYPHRKMWLPTSTPQCLGQSLFTREWILPPLTTLQVPW